MSLRLLKVVASTHTYPPPYIEVAGDEPGAHGWYKEPPHTTHPEHEHVRNTRIDHLVQRSGQPKDHVSLVHDKHWAKKELHPSLRNYLIKKELGI